MSDHKSDPWREWCLHCVEEARGYAAQAGVCLEIAMFRILTILLADTRRQFPNVEVNVIIRELTWWAARAGNAAQVKSD